MHRARLPLSAARFSAPRSGGSRCPTSVRFASTGTTPPPPPPPFSSPPPPSVGKAASFLQRHTIIKWGVITTGSIIFGLTATTAIILGYDAFTYKEAHVGNVPASPLALHPQPGGPKNLPILSHFVEDGVEDPNAVESKALPKKERLVIVGGGWAAVALLKTLNPDEYDITLIAPNNFFLL
jgi:hypothetical protein